MPSMSREFFSLRDMTILEDSSFQRFVTLHLQKYEAELGRLAEKPRPAEELSRGKTICDADLWQKLGYEPRP